MELVNESLHHSGLTEQERADVQAYNDVREAAAKYPEGSAMRAMLDKRLASLEIKLGL